MDTKHTPTPWHMTGADQTWTVYGLNDQGYNRFSALIQVGNTAPLEWTSAEEMKANAHLIVSAPELLDALQEVFVIGDRLVSDVYGHEFVEKARAAIAKARGEA